MSGLFELNPRIFQEATTPLHDTKQFIGGVNKHAMNMAETATEQVRLAEQMKALKQQMMLIRVNTNNKLCYFENYNKKALKIVVCSKCTLQAFLCSCCI